MYHNIVVRNEVLKVYVCRKAVSAHHACCWGAKQNSNVLLAVLCSMSNELVAAIPLVNSPIEAAHSSCKAWIVICTCTCFCSLHSAKSWIRLVQLTCNMVEHLVSHFLSPCIQRSHHFWCHSIDWPSHTTLFTRWTAVQTQLTSRKTNVYCSDHFATSRVTTLKQYARSLDQKTKLKRHTFISTH